MFDCVLNTLLQRDLGGLTLEILLFDIFGNMFYNLFMTLVLSNTNFASKVAHKVPCYNGKYIHKRGFR